MDVLTVADCFNASARSMAKTPGANPMQASKIHEMIRLFLFLDILECMIKLSQRSIELRQRIRKFLQIFLIHEESYMQRKCSILITEHSYGHSKRLLGPREFIGECSDSFGDLRASSGLGKSQQFCLGLDHRRIIRHEKTVIEELIIGEIEELLERSAGIAIQSAEQ